MQIEVYNMEAVESDLTITLEAVCDSFSSLLWDIEYYKCGSFEVYIAANPQNIEIFQTGRIVGRDDDSQHFGIIESVQIDTDAENGDYLTVNGRFLLCLLERRIINPTLSITADTAYSDIVRNAVTLNAIQQDNRRIPGLSLGTVAGTCWEQTATLQVSYANLMEWVYTICEKIGGTANIRLVKDIGETYKMVLDLSEETDRSLMQDTEPHIIFSDAYSNLLSFSYASDSAITRNFAYIYGHGEGAERKHTTYCVGDEPTYLDRYELYVDAKDISEEEQVEGETVPIPEEKYIELLKTRGSEKLVDPKTASESEIAADSTQYVYNRDYCVGDYVTVEHKRFGMIQPKVQLIGMIEAFDQNGRIIDREVWGKVQELIKVRYRNDEKGALRSGGNKHFLHDKMICGCCGEAMTRRTLRGYTRPGQETVKYKAWECSGHHKGRKGNGCKMRAVKEEKILRAIEDVIGCEVTEKTIKTVIRIIVSADDIRVDTVD